MMRLLDLSSGFPRRLLRRQSAWRLTLLMSLSVLLLCQAARQPTVKADDSSPPNLELVRSSYLQTVSSIRSIDCRFTYTKIADMRGTDGPPGIHESQVEYTRDGKRQVFSLLSLNEEGKSGIRVWVSFDGTVYSSWAESHKENAEEGYFAPWGRVSPEKPMEVQMTQTVDSFLGYHLLSGETSLEQLIQSPDTRVIGWDDVQGHRCVKVECARHARDSRFPDKQWETITWLDPDAGYLPRRIHHVAADGKKQEQDLLVEEFGQYPNHGGGKDVLLPRKTVREWGGISRQMVLEQADVNRPIPSKKFQPTFPPGAMVKETVPGKSERKYVVGSEDLRKELIQKATAKAPPAAPELQLPATVPSARPTEPGIAGWITALRVGAWSSLIVLAALFAWRAFHRASA